MLSGLTMCSNGEHLMNNSGSTCKKALIEASVWSASSAYRQNSCAEGFDNTHGVAVIRHIESKYQLGVSSANADTCQSVGVTVVASRELGPECKFLPESSIMDIMRALSFTCLLALDAIAFDRHHGVCPNPRSAVRSLMWEWPLLVIEP